MQRLHTDGEGEYRVTKVPNHTKTTPETLQHNPLAEQCNRTIFEPVRVMLEQAELNRHYWLYAAEHVAHVKNIIPHSHIECSPFDKPAFAAEYFRAPSLKSSLHSKLKEVNLLVLFDIFRYAVAKNHLKYSFLKFHALQIATFRKLWIIYLKKSYQAIFQLP